MHEIAAVETNATDRDARCFQFRRERHDFARGRLGVVGVEQQHHIIGRARAKLRRRVSSSNASTEGMRHVVPNSGMPKFSPASTVRGAGEARDIACPRRHQSGLAPCARRKPKSTKSLRRRMPAPERARLGRDQRVEKCKILISAIRRIAPAARRGDSQDRLIGEERRAFGHGMDVAGERKSPRYRVGFCRTGRAFEPRDLGCREAKILQKSSACSSPAASKNPRRAGSERTNSSKTAVSVSPWSR